MAIDINNSTGNNRTSRIRAKSTFLTVIGFMNGVNYNNYNENTSFDVPELLIVGFFGIGIVSAICLLLIVCCGYGQDHISMKYEWKKFFGFVLLIATANAMSCMYIRIYELRGIVAPSIYSSLMFVPTAILLAIDVQKL